MDRAKSKKIRNIRVIATNIFMSISVVAIVFVLMLIAMGFTFNESGGLEQAGLAQIVSHPSSANVEIDGNNQMSRTEFSKMLSAGTHSIRISKPGYDTWTKNLKIDAGLLTRVEWVRLFPKKFESQDTLSFNNLQGAFFSANRKHLIIQEKETNTLKRVDIQSDNPHADELKLNECLGTKDEIDANGKLSILSWNDDNSKAIAKWTIGDKTSWHLIDFNHPDRSINLSQEYSLSFDSILIANDGATKLWAIEKNNLHLIDLNNHSVTSTIATNIEKIANNKNTVSFINIDNDKKRHLGIFKEGEQNYTELATLDNANDNSIIRLAMGTYWSEEWLAYSVDQQLKIISGKYPNYDKDNKKSSLEEKLNEQIDFLPMLASVNVNQRILVLSGENKLFSFDFETKEKYNVELTSSITDITWLDDYIIWQNIDNKVFARDFDGDNRREIIPAVDNPFPAIISENNKYLYYFDITETESITEGADSPSDADPTTNTEKDLKYTLKRQKLEI